MRADVRWDQSTDDEKMAQERKEKAVDDALLFLYAINKLFAAVRGAIRRAVLLLCKKIARCGNVFI
nr:hypothetical protein [uncultured Agathobaculum sp.]